MIVWRTDGRKFETGEAVTSAGDHTATLDGAHAETERILRDAMGDGGDTRRTSLYTWEDEVWARRAWSLEKGKFLYKLEVEDGDVRHRGDVNHYTDVGDAVKAGKDAVPYAEAYVRGDVHDPKRYTRARVQILVRKAIVLERYAT